MILQDCMGFPKVIIERKLSERVFYKNARAVVNEHVQQTISACIGNR